jgi:hypothetical protein
VPSSNRTVLTLNLLEEGIDFGKRTPSEETFGRPGNGCEDNIK